MRGKEGQVRAENEQDDFGYTDVGANRFKSQPRLDLNDLLKRMKDQKKDDKKTNTLILSGAAGVAAVVLIIICIFY